MGQWGRRLTCCGSHVDTSDLDASDGEAAPASKSHTANGVSSAAAVQGRGGPVWDGAAVIFGCKTLNIAGVATHAPAAREYAASIVSDTWHDAASDDFSVCSECLLDAATAEHESSTGFTGFLDDGTGHVSPRPCAACPPSITSCNSGSTRRGDAAAGPAGSRVTSVASGEQDGGGGSGAAAGNPQRHAAVAASGTGGDGGTGAHAASNSHLPHALDATGSGGVARRSSSGSHGRVCSSEHGLTHAALPARKSSSADDGGDTIGTVVRTKTLVGSDTHVLTSCTSTGGGTGGTLAPGGTPRPGPLHNPPPDLPFVDPHNCYVAPPAETGLAGYWDGIDELSSPNPMPLDKFLKSSWLARKAHESIKGFLVIDSPTTLTIRAKLVMAGVSIVHSEVYNKDGSITSSVLRRDLKPGYSTYRMWFTDKNVLILYVETVNMNGTLDHVGVEHMRLLPDGLLRCDQAVSKNGQSATQHFVGRREDLSPHGKKK